MGNCSGRDEKPATGDDNKPKPKPKATDGTVDSAWTAWANDPANLMQRGELIDSRDEICTVLHEISYNNRFQHLTTIQLIKRVDSRHWHFLLEYTDENGRERSQVQWCSVETNVGAVTSTPPSGHPF